MQKRKIAVNIIVLVLLFAGTIIFLFTAGNEAKQDYFNAKVLENRKDVLIVEADKEYEELIKRVGETITIKKAAVVGKCDFSVFTEGEEVRIVYYGTDRSKKEIERVFMVYLLSEIDTEKYIIIEDAPEETNHEFVPNK